MTNRMRRSILPACLVAACLVAAPVRAEPVFLDETAAGQYELQGETVLQLRGFAGSVSFRIGEEGRLRFLSSELEDRKAERPVELWKDGRTLILRPAAGYDGVPARLEGAVPPGVSLDVEFDDAELMLGNIDGDVVIVGDRLDTRLATVRGNVSIEGNDGKVRADQVQGDFEVEGTGLQMGIQAILGSFTANLEGSSFDAGRVKGPVELDADGTEATLDKIESAVRVTMSGGSVHTDGLGGGGEFRLDGTVLELRNCAGDFRVGTDAPISFENCKADFHFDAYGSSLTGTGNEGILEIKTDDTEVVLRKLMGPTRIQGDRLAVDIQEVGGELWVQGSSSNVKVDNITGPLMVINEFGDIHVLAAAQKVDVENLDGNVTIERQVGPVNVIAEGERVTVSWTSMNWSENSVVENRSGDVALFLPKQGGCTVDARTSYGRIETDVEGIVIGDDGRSASGSVNRARRPILNVRAEGDLRIMKATTVEK